MRSQREEKDKTPRNLNNSAVKLVMTLNSRSARSIEAFINSVQNLASENYKIELIGIGPSFREVAQYMRNELNEGDLITSINKNASQLANGLKKEGGHVVIYSGALHNDFKSKQYEGSDFSYVPLLKKNIPFISLDIIASDYLRFSDNSAEWNAIKHPPTKGVRLFQTGFKSNYVLVFPREKKETTPAPSFNNNEFITK